MTFWDKFDFMEAFSMLSSDMVNSEPLAYDSVSL